MTEDLPSEFDLVVIGTGLSESIVAAAASRIGKTVLHLDTNEYYGGFWASFDLKSLINYAEQEKQDNIYQISDNQLEINNNTQISNVHIEWSDSEPEDVNKVIWNKERMLTAHRKFNIDLSPKLLYARGELVELLISSNICRYAEFRPNDNILTLINDKLVTVPCSRSDVFTNKEVTVVEKRLLMKFLNTCVPTETGEASPLPIDSKNKTFMQYLREFKVTDNLIHYILYSIAMGNESTSCKEGIENVTHFLCSIGRYGNTPFLFPMYGCGEVAQCFCRLCAVFGGIYCLRRPYSKITFNDSNEQIEFNTIQCGNQIISSKNLVIGNGNISSGIVLEIEPHKEESTHKICGRLSRGILITDSPLGEDVTEKKSGGGVTFLKLPGEGNDSGVYLLQLNHLTGTCPKGLYLMHLTSEQKVDAKADLQPFVDKLFKSKTEAIEAKSPERVKPEILFSCYFNIPSCLKCNFNSVKLPAGVNLACGPAFELDFDYSIEEARKIFSKIYPTEAFLPRAPDPEEILMDDENATEVKLEDADFAVEAENLIDECNEASETENKENAD